ncbi:MAG: c-type cytochrome [Parafilimonas sp.]|nr:c-type cytochrome [Parafilimonas sp.]
MIHSNKRKVNLLLFFAACIFVSIAATKPSASTTAATKPIPASDTGIYKNLKVLPKDISKDSLDHVMHNFTASLGVRCNFCHVFNNGKMDFASDEKEEKEIARYMMTMTAGINKTYFNSENSTRPDTISVIKCFTCHRGSPHPDEASMGMNNSNMPPPSPQHDSSSKMPAPNQ